MARQEVRKSNGLSHDIERLGSYIVIHMTWEGYVNCLTTPHCLCNVHFRRSSLDHIQNNSFGAFHLSSRLCHLHYDGCICATTYSWLTWIFSSKVFRCPVWLTGFQILHWGFWQCKIVRLRFGGKFDARLEFESSVAWAWTKRTGTLLGPITVVAPITPILGPNRVPVPTGYTDM